MLKLSALVRLLKTWSFKRGRGLTTAVIPLGVGGRKANYALNRPAAVRACVCWMNTDRLLLAIPPLTPPMNPTSVALINPYYRSNSNRSEEHTSELQSLMRISYAVFCLKKKKSTQKIYTEIHQATHTHKNKLSTDDP